MTKEEMISYALTQLPDSETYPKDIFNVEVPAGDEQAPVIITFKKHLHYPEHGLSCKATWQIE